MQTETAFPMSGPDIRAGVPATELCCPTCGVLYGPTNLDARVYRAAETIEEQTAIQIGDAILPRYGDMIYLVCVNGHAWSIKKIFRWPIEDPHPDLVILGEYLPELP